MPTKGERLFGEETQQVAFRLPVSMLDRLYARLDRERQARPGARITLADIVRALLLSALGQGQAPAPLPLDPEIGAWEHYAAAMVGQGGSQDTSPVAPPPPPHPPHGAHSTGAARAAEALPPATGAVNTPAPAGGPFPYPPFDPAKHMCGALCRRGHAYQETGLSLRLQRNGSCVMCEIERSKRRGVTHRARTKAERS